MTRLFVILTVTFLSCGTPKENIKNLTLGADTIINCTEHIKLVGHHSDEFGGTSFKPITVFFDNNKVFQDTLNEYWLLGNSSKDYPKYLQCADGSCQLLIEIDQRPNQPELFRLKVTKEGQAQQDRLPLFEWKPKDVDNDGKLEVSGILTNGEQIAGGDTILYNPTLVYELSENCLTLDSSATIARNKKIWGNFYGYIYNDKLSLWYNKNE